jgi:hypothetical protein
MILSVGGGADSNSREKMLSVQKEEVFGQPSRAIPSCGEPVAMTEDEFAKAFSLLSLEERQAFVRCMGATH